MKRARVLIVDDSMVIRRLITEAIAAEASIDVIGDAANGRVALQKIAQLAPDLVTLDVEMPEMDGLATLREIRAAYPRLPVVMFSALTERGAADTLEALHHGASDYVTKPASAAGKDVALQRIRHDLIPKIKSLCRIGVVAASPAPAPAAVPRFVYRSVGAGLRVEAIAIAASTGGPAALADVLGPLPADLPVPILIVQHMPNLFTRLLADRLNGQTALNVCEASDGQPVRGGTVYVAPGDFHLAVHRSGGGVVIALTRDAPEHSHRPAADVLFRSVAAAYGAHALGVVMTGMGGDALNGSEAIAHAGGRVVVQDETTSVVWEMAGRVVQAGLAHGVFPLREIAPELLRSTGCVAVGS